MSPPSQGVAALNQVNTMFIIWQIALPLSKRILLSTRKAEAGTEEEEVMRTRTEGPRPDGRLVEARRRIDRSRARLLTTAARLLRDLGYEGLTVETLSREARVGRTTFYKHFKGKADLLGAMVAEVATRVEAAIVPVRRLPDRDGVADEVIANMQRVVDVFEASLPLFRVLFGGGRWTAGIEEEAMEALERRMLDIIREALEQGARFRLVRPLDIEVSALAIWGSFHKAILQPLARGLISAQEARRRVPLLVDYHVGGLLGS